MKRFTCPETAALVRQSLKEAFKGIKFSVKSRSYSMGASISVSWVDGPNSTQVDAVIGRFAGSYFDGMQDYQGTRYHMLDGLQVTFGADSIHTSRQHSDAAIMRAIDFVFMKYQCYFEQDALQKPTITDYKEGCLHLVQLNDIHANTDQNLQREIGQVLRKHSDRLKVDTSPTAARVFQTHTDGYGHSSFDAHKATL